MKANPYEDIINLQRHVSAAHPQMPISERAAQFSPFAALRGYDAAVQEAARLTDTRIELDEYMQTRICERLNALASGIAVDVPIEVTYFVRDQKKKGGSYRTSTGCVRGIDSFKGTLTLDNGDTISIKEIVSLEGEGFT